MAETDFNPEGQKTKKQVEEEEGEEAGEDISYETTLCERQSIMHASI